MKEPLKFVVESGVPIPAKGVRFGGNYFDVLKSMKPGESVKCEVGRAVTGFFTAAKRNGMEVTSRKREEGGWRVWRVK